LFCSFIVGRYDYNVISHCSVADGTLKNSDEEVEAKERVPVPVSSDAFKNYFYYHLHQVVASALVSSLIDSYLWIAPRIVPVLSKDYPKYHTCI
jgi:hypothetical protein